jgi:hypothetical protein
VTTDHSDQDHLVLSRTLTETLDHLAMARSSEEAEALEQEEA